MQSDHAAVQSGLADLARKLEGDLAVDLLTRTAYSTDASEYQERPLAVACPKSANWCGSLRSTAWG